MAAEPHGWVGYAFSLVAAILLLGFPRQVLRSLQGWVGPREPDAIQARRSALSRSAVAARMRGLVAPTLLFAPANEPGFSKIGGDPQLPPSLEWPIGAKRPRTFLAQVDLGDLAPNWGIDWLPNEGRIYAFWDPDGGDAVDAVRILYSAEAAGEATLRPRGAAKPFPERRLAFMKFTSAPSLDWLGLDASELDLGEDDYEALERIADAPPPDEIQHRIGGYPNEIQPAQMALACEHAARSMPEPRWGENIPPAIDRASKEWRMLLQIDSDPALKMNFGDGGRLYVFVRERHARASDFSKTVTLSQSY